MERLAEIRAVLNSPELKTKTLSDTRWLACERYVTAVQRSLPAWVSTFEDIYDNKIFKAQGIATLLIKYKLILKSMLRDVLHTVAKLPGSM